MFTLLNPSQPGSREYRKDHELIARVHDLGNHHGFDLVAAIAAQIEQVWRSDYARGHDWPNPVNDSELHFGNVTHIAYALNELAKVHGYGLVPQIAQGVADLAVRPGSIAKYRECHDKRMRYLDAASRVANGTETNEDRDILGLDT